MVSLDRAFLVAVVNLLLLAACSGVDTAELWTGVRASDQADIRAAARAITSSRITEFRPWPADKPTEIILFTDGGRIYSAKKVGGKWQIKDITDAVVY